MKQSIYILSLFIFLLSCNQPQPIDLEAEREKILELHKLQRDYHFNKDSIAFANQLSDNFISVNRGLITTPTNEETTARYNNYFSAVAFERWDDVSEPIIRFSEDGKLAYTIVDKLVVLTYDDGEGNMLEDETHYAWTAIYKKYDNEWKIDCVTSTEIPK
ncbi:MAG: nuclear transport factor 2 family protein [Bacteroidota bacterium]